MSNVITRFAPSPTGFLHAGNYRTAIYSYLYAKQNKGKFFLRIEDTDKERSKKEYEDNIIESLKWLGLDYDAFYRQSEHIVEHKKYLKQLVDKGFAYISKEEPKNSKIEDKNWHAEVIRFKNPNTKIKFKDLIRGEIEVDTTDLKDFVIAKDFETPLFHFAVVLDDFTMGVTHVIRGEDHISNTPRQILIGRAIGAPELIYAHLPLILNADRSKLSKRKGALAITEYQERGYLPEAILNYLALLGWNPGTEQELLSINDLLKQFDISKVQKGGAVFNEEKLNWFNKQYIKMLSPKEIKERIKTNIPEIVTKISEHDEIFERAIPMIIDHVSTFGEIETLYRNGEFEYLFKDPFYTRDALLWRDESSEKITAERLGKVLELLNTLKTFTSENVKEAIWAYANEEGKGGVLWPMRYALSGRDKSPDPFMLASILGKETTLRRITNAKNLLEKI